MLTESSLVCRKGLGLTRLYGFSRRRQDCKEVTDYAEISDFKERRLRVLIDDDDCLRRLHAGAVLDSAQILVALKTRMADFKVPKQCFVLAELPRNSSATRMHNRCQLTGRPHAFYRKLKLSRIMLRDLASFGQIPGMVKSSW